MSGGIVNLKGVGEVRANKREVVEVFASVAFGAAGAPTVAAGCGIASMTRTAQGKYTLVFDQPYHTLLDFNGMPVAATPDSWAWQVDTDWVMATKTLILWFVDEGATAQDPVSGDTHKFRFTFKLTAL